MKTRTLLSASLFSLVLAATGAYAQEDAAAMAKKLSNPVAALISVPFQLNYDHDLGPFDDGDKWTLNIQPVIPISLNEDWNLISRTILPVVWQNDLTPFSGDQFGLSDTLQSLFFSPKAPTSGGLIWGAGPVFLLPTGTDDMLSAEKWAAGPTALVLKQSGPWTVGILANHLWSFAGDDDRDDINSTYLQPFMSYTTPKAWTFGLSSESTYNWETEQWGVPVVANVSKMTKIGKQLVSIGGGVRYWVESPDNGPEGLSLRLVTTLLFPKK